MLSTSADTALHAMTEADVDAAALVAFDAHRDAAGRLGVPSEHPTVDFSRGMFHGKLRDPRAIAWVATRNGRVVGSVFLNDFVDVAVIGPLTTHPTEGVGAGRVLMKAALAEAEARGRADVRLVQSPAHLRSLALYLKMGFEVREPLVLLQGTLTTAAPASVRSATEHDVSRCRELAESVLGVSRESEVRQAIAQGTATVLERGDALVGYATGLGLRGHAVAVSEEALVALLARSTPLPGPGFFAPVRNTVLMRSALASGMTFAWPATLMTRGRYLTPRGGFIPSIAF